MSGSSKVNGLGNNPPQVILNEIENVNRQPAQNGNVGQSQVQSAVESADLSKSGELLKQLDVLLLRAAKSATKPMNADEAKELKTVIGGLKISRADRKSLERAIDQVSQELKNLQKFTGRELASGVVIKDGVFDWAKNDVGGSIRKNLDAQATLSAQLGKLLNAHPDAATAELLEEAMLQCDRRASEITTLAMQFADLENSGQGTPEVQARLDKRLSTFLPAQSLKMHGNAEALAKMQEHIAPLASRLERYASQTNVAVSATEMAALRSEIQEMSSALDLAMKEGLPSGNGRVMVDRSLLGEARKILAEVGAKFENLRKSVGEAAMKKVVAQAFQPLPDLDIISEENRPLLKHLAPSLCGAVNYYEQLCAKVNEFAADPSEANMNNLVDTFCKYTQFCKTNSPNIKKDLQTLVQIGESDMPDVAAEKLIRSRQVGKHVNIFGNAFHRFVYAAVEMAGQHHMGVLPNAKEKSLANYLLNFFDNPGTLASQVAHLVEIKNNIDNLALDKLATGTSVRMAFAGNFSTSTLVEARIHGMADADIDPMVDDSRMVSSRQLGKGKANSVFEVTYKDGNKFVFKPETAGRLGMTNLTLGRRGYAAQLQVAQINMAVQKTADTLGLGDIMVKTTVGSHQGNYGIFMEKAPGVPACDFTKYSDKAPEDGLSLKDVLRLPPEKYEKVVGQVMRQLNRLQWFDAITGQGDRHSNNYFVHIGKDLKVTVKAIDNDMSFSDYRIGLRTYRLVGEHAVNFRKRLKEAQTMIYPQEKGTINLLPDPGVTATQDGYIVDSTKIQSPELHYCVNKSIGLHDCALPDAIDQGLFENLMKLKSGPEREEHLGQLRSRLSDEAFDAAVKRLDEAIAHAEKLQTEGKVFAPEDFEKHEIQKKILKNNSSLKLPERNHSAPLSTPEAKDAVKQYRKHNCDLFTRDLLLKLGKGKWFS